MHDFDLTRYTARRPGELPTLIGFLAQLVHEGAPGYRITDDGEPLAVMVGWEQWQELQARLGAATGTGDPR